MTALVVLLGHGIGYSASPAIHNAAFAAMGLDVRYELADVAASDLRRTMAALRGDDRLGANVTQPHKLAACDLVDAHAPEVERLGAANTIVREEGRLRAHNTDLAAIADEVAEMGTFLRAVVLGSGGASRAAGVALTDAGTKVRIIDRRHWDALPEALADADLVVNATPIGTASDTSPIPSPLLSSTLAVLDLVYRPSPTRLVRDARAVGSEARDGTGVLLRQAMASFELWTRHTAPRDVMEDALRVALHA